MNKAKQDKRPNFNPIPKLLKFTGATALLRTYQPRLESIVSSDGFEIPVTVVGNKPNLLTTAAKDKPKPVLLLHAFGMDARQVLPFILPLASQYCFYLPHFRGFGLAADTPSIEFDFIEQYADDLDALLTHICVEHGTEDVDVAAISMGALVVWAHFNRYVGSISSVGSIDSIGSNGSENRDLSLITANKPTLGETAFNRTDSKHSPKSPASTLSSSSKTATDETTLNETPTHRSKPNHKIRSYLNIDQSPIVHNQPDWLGGMFGDQQNEVFAQFREVLEATQPYLTEHDFNKFSHLPFDIKQSVTAMETAFSLMAVDRLPSRLIVNTTGYLPAHKLSIFQHSTWIQKLKGLHAYLELPYDYRHTLPFIDTPITMLIGGQSKLYDPQCQRKIADILPNAKVIEIAEAGHAIPIDAPLRFARLLKQFLAD